MKHFLLSIVTILVCLPAYSQINLKDSTVQVVAYWAKGDKYNYSMNSSAYEVIGNDTVLISKSMDMFTLEIIDSTDTGYLVQYKVLEENFHFKDGDVNDIVNQLSRATDNIPIILKTDQYGTFEGIANFEEYKKLVFEAVEMTRDAVFKIMESKSEEANLNNEQEEEAKAQVDLMINNVFNMIKNENFVYKSIEPVLSLLNFHGGKYELGMEYSSETVVQSPFEAGKTLDAKHVFNIHKIFPETSTVVFYHDLIYNEEQLMEGVMTMMNKMLPPDQQITDKSEAGSVKFNILSQINVHTDTGWPLYGYNVHETVTPEKTKVKEWEIEIILE